jgi:biopolymer transport protein ExbD
MAMKLGGSGDAISPEVNVTPLVDVALVVLIIFMVVTPLLVRQVNLHLPSPDTNAAPATPSEEVPIVVSVDAKGVVRLGRDEVDESELARRLPRMIAASRTKIVHFDADDALPYADAVRVVDRARGAGASKIAIVTKPLTR